MIYPLTQRTSFVLRATVTDGGDAVDIRDDTLTLLVKKSQFDSDENAVIEKVANVSVYGENGIAYWILTTTDTDLIGDYFFAIKRVSGTYTYVPLDGKFRFKRNLFD